MQSVLQFRPSPRTYHPRRPHRKSRAGCLVCKQRRVKCDEVKPSCHRCQKLGFDCSYEPETKDKDSVSVFLASPPDSKAYCMSVDTVTKKINEILQLDSKSGPLPVVQALQHFHHGLTNPALGPKGAQSAMQAKIIQLGFNSPFLLHTIIAAATSHIRHLASDGRVYTFTETYHWQQGITQYSREVTTIGPKNTDSLISACLLLTIRSFALDEYDPLSSFVFSDDIASLSWLTLQGGLRHLIMATARWKAGSMWWEVFMKSQNETVDLFEDERPGRVAIHPGLADLCGIDDTTTAETNPYHAPARILTGLLSLERGIDAERSTGTDITELVVGFDVWNRYVLGGDASKVRDHGNNVVLGLCIALTCSGVSINLCPLCPSNHQTPVNTGDYNKTMLSTLLAALCPCSCTNPTPPPPPNTTTTNTYNNHHHHNSIQYQPPLEPTLTLPAYTPHPNTETLNEKTLALHLRDPPISSSSYNNNNNSFPLDEKHRYTTTTTTTPTSSTPPDGISTSNNAATADDASSQISFPSTTHSYGNTSTATRETPPPPYSPTWRGHAEGEVEGVISPVPSLSFSGDGERSRSVSVSGRSSGSWGEGGSSIADEVGIVAPRGVYIAGQGGRGDAWSGSIGEEYYGVGYGVMDGRVSYESGRSGGGRRRGSWGV
ncbi:hypothetical protein ASPFODRAFT_63616 [Aspergillus luchuensis CBS 106.47]|uniref:Zn(2)-C6 fungal-type domain-containing protein n=1 Tax=Aspergillus luchuensis (strain CBS 106.47) TaxID=1137211 RepID=A0A1M3T9Q7_ASPLC|nr:hypothetical protein ASPFODRAFT_63616 [Aspergillus luchuensis CBS 106.47]